MFNHDFTGFNKEGIQFLSNLSQNNNKLWFDQNKQIFKNKLESPAKAFLSAIITELDISFNLKVEGKIFRIYRDIRFSKDKTPYNSHLRMSFTIPGKKAGPALMLSIEHNKNLILGCGIFEFSKEDKDTYREFITNDKAAFEFDKIIEDIKTNKYKIDIPSYKKIPAGYDESHPRANMLKAKGITIWQKCSLPNEFYNKKAVEYCINTFQTILPLFRWLDF